MAYDDVVDIVKVRRVRDDDNVQLAIFADVAGLPATNFVGPEACGLPSKERGDTDDGSSVEEGFFGTELAESTYARGGTRLPML